MQYRHCTVQAGADLSCRSPYPFLIHLHLAHISVPLTGHAIASYELSGNVDGKEIIYM